MPDLSYPIGKFHYEAPLSEQQKEEQKQKYLSEIERTQIKLRAAVEGFSQQQLDTPYRPEGWTVRQVVHHVPDSHMNAYVRFKLALTEEQPPIKPYDEAAWADLADTHISPVEVSLQLLAALHTRWVDLLRAMPPSDFGRTLYHPEHGVLP